MRRISIIAIAVFLVTPWLGAQILGASDRQGLDNAPRLFAVNLWRAPVDIQLGDQSNFSVEGLQPAAPATMQLLTSWEPLKLYYKPSAETVWRTFLDAAGQPYGFSFQPGSSYLIRLGADGLVTVLALAKPQPGMAHVAILNNCGTVLDEAAMLPTGSNPRIEVQALPNQAFTEFTDLPVGNYGGSWKIGAARSFIAGMAMGTQGLVKLQADGWYLFLVSAQTGGTLWDITPPAGF